MKVCDVVCNSVWYDPRVRKQIIEYRNNGIDVCAVGLRCGRYDKDKISQIPCKTTVVCIDERFEGKQKSILRKLWREHLRKKGIREAVLNEAPDVIHANDLDALMAVYPAYKKLKCKLVYDSHEICAENIGSVKRYKFTLPFVKRYERHLIKHLHQMVCVSNAAADYFVKAYKIKRPMVVTNCSLASEAVGEVPKNKGFEVLNHGQFYDGRGYDIMVESAPMLEDRPEIKLALRGFGAMEEKLRARKEELDAENVIFYPKVRVEELIPEAARSHVGVAITVPICLNFELSVSNKIFEYAAAGLPVIMSDIPEHRYLNEKYRIGIILKDNSPECFAEAVRRLYDDRDFYNQCKAGARRMSEEINWETEFGKLIEAEKALCSSQV